jgi:hypothetical protein
MRTRRAPSAALGAALVAASLLVISPAAGAEPSPTALISGTVTVVPAEHEGHEAVVLLSDSRGRVTPVEWFDGAAPQARATVEVSLPRDVSDDLSASRQAALADTPAPLGSTVSKAASSPHRTPGRCWTS